MKPRTLPQSAQFPKNLRALDIRRDLASVADLVELCFADHLHDDGRRYLRQLRLAARSGPLLDLAAARGIAGLPLSGYVWLENDVVVGNLTLMPYGSGSHRRFNIANVAVHSSFRQRGIAKALTQAALRGIKSRGVTETWLQVDEKNQNALGLFHSLGFVEKMRRTSWRATPGRTLTGPLDGIRPRQPSDWPHQKRWLEATYPEDVRWLLPLNIHHLRPYGLLNRIIRERTTRHWSAEKRGEMLGVLTWQSPSRGADRLWLAVSPNREEEAISMLLDYANGHNRLNRSLTLDYPGGQSDTALKQVGFVSKHTLIWMTFPWENNEPAAKLSQQ
ncbi:MAG: GNAT family N-acetyltransferase [Anaerolineales bacterium]